MWCPVRVVVLLVASATAWAQDPEPTSEEFFPGEQAILDQIEAEDAAEAASAQATDAGPSAFPTYVAPLVTDTSIEALREQGQSSFDQPGVPAVEQSFYDAIDDGYIPVPPVPEPVPVETSE